MTMTNLDQINGKIPTWVRRTAGEHQYWLARATIHGVGPAVYGQRSAIILVRVAQRPTDGRWITDLAYEPGSGYKTVRCVAESDTIQQAQVAAVERMPELARVIAERYSPSAVTVGPPRVQWAPTP